MRAMGVLVSDWSTALVGIDAGGDAWADDAGTVCSMGLRDVSRQAGEGGSLLELIAAPVVAGILAGVSLLGAAVRRFAR